MSKNKELLDRVNAQLDELNGDGEVADGQTSLKDTVQDDLVGDKTSPDAEGDLNKPAYPQAAGNQPKPSEDETSDEEESEEASDTEDDSESEEKSDDEQDSEDEEEKPKLSKEQIRERFKGRERKRINRMEERFGDRLGKLESMLETVVSQLASGNKGQQQQAEDKIVDYAKKHNLDPDGLKELTGIIQDQVAQKLKPSDEEDESQGDEDEEQETATVDRSAEDQYFSAEWGEFEPELLEAYPNASAKQISEAKKLMDQISHSSQKLAQYELGDILHSPRFKSQFDDILASPKKKGFEVGRGKTGESESGIEDNADADITSTKQALAWQKKSHQQSGNFLDGLPISRASERRF